MPVPVAIAQVSVLRQPVHIAPGSMGGELCPDYDRNGDDMNAKNERFGSDL
jgi:hypothetical protein